MSLGNELQSKLSRLFEAREQRDADKIAAEKSEKEYRELEAEVWDELDESPISGALKIEIPGRGTVTFQPRETYYGRIIDKDALMEYLEQRALTDELTEIKFSGARINEIVREHVEAGKAMPPGLDFYARRPVSISKAKG